MFLHFMVVRYHYNHISNCQHLTSMLYRLVYGAITASLVRAENFFHHDETEKLCMVSFLECWYWKLWTAMMRNHASRSIYRWLQAASECTRARREMYCINNRGVPRSGCRGHVANFRHGFTKMLALKQMGGWECRGLVCRAEGLPGIMTGFNVFNFWDVQNTSLRIIRQYQITTRGDIHP